MVRWPPSWSPYSRSTAIRCRDRSPRGRRELGCAGSRNAPCQKPMSEWARTGRGSAGGTRPARARLVAERDLWMEQPAVQHRHAGADVPQRYAPSRWPHPTRRRRRRRPARPATCRPRSRPSVESSCSRDGISSGRWVASSERSASARRAVSRAHRCKRRARQHQRAAGGRQRRDRHPVGHSVSLRRTHVQLQALRRRRRTSTSHSRRSRKDANMINEANTGFMLLAASLVMLMTPGLAFFYGGLVGRKNMLAIMIQSFVSMGWTTVIWWLVGYSLCFSGGADGIIGNFDVAFLRNVTSVVDVHALAHPADRVHRLPDDVRDHHAGADHRRVRQPRHVQGVPALPDRLAAVRLLPVRPHDLGRRHARAVGRARLRRRHRRPRHRRLGGARLGAVRGQAQVRRHARTASRSSRSAPACSGSAGTASTPAASSGSTPSPRSRS